MKRQDKISSWFSTIKCLVIFYSVFFPVINCLHASEAIDDKFGIAFGGYSLVRYDSTLSLTDESAGAGVSINPIDAFGLETEQTVLRLDAHYRFNAEHALTFSQYSIKAQGNKTLSKDVEWQDENGNQITIPLGSKIDTSLDYDIYKVGYLWSFYHTDKINLAVGAGLHLTRVAVGLSVNGTVTSADPKDIRTTVPMPVLAYGLTYRVTPNYQWYIKSEFFALKFDTWDGIYTDTVLGMEYRAFDQIGLGLGLGSNSLKLTEKTSDYTFNYDNRITGILFYVAGYY